MKVEPMTLKALVRERIEAGKDMPTELFNIFVGNKTTIKGNNKHEPSSNKKEGALATNIFEADADKRCSKHIARRSCVAFLKSFGTTISGSK